MNMNAQAMHILAQLTKEIIPSMEVAYSHGELGIPWIGIGHRRFGPVLQWGAGGWVNIFSHGDFCQNFTSGGTWSCLGGKSLLLTIGQALNAREGDFSALFPHSPYGGKLANVAAHTEELRNLLKSFQEVY